MKLKTDRFRAFKYPSSISMDSLSHPSGSRLPVSFMIIFFVFAFFVVKASSSSIFPLSFWMIECTSALLYSMFRTTSAVKAPPLSNSMSMLCLILLRRHPHKVAITRSSFLCC